ncbi:unnamed protein product [Pieris macdunnoughi]|uniref:Uncharacterized protein n=1 Tax=Pieris macdunnoughi TaxID=345717 RepID=A0A821P6C4_9NEOP|nr:unnamed protein product [Pieris macdunnoughi]
MSYIQRLDTKKDRKYALMNIRIPSQADDAGPRGSPRHSTQGTLGFDTGLNKDLRFREAFPSTKPPASLHSTLSSALLQHNTLTEEDHCTPDLRTSEQSQHKPIQVTHSSMFVPQITPIPRQYLRKPKGTPPSIHPVF